MKFRDYINEKILAWIDKDGTKYYEGDKISWAGVKGKIIANDDMQAYVFRPDNAKGNKDDRRLSGADKGMLKKI